MKGGGFLQHTSGEMSCRLSFFTATNVSWPSSSTNLLFSTTPKAPSAPKEPFSSAAAVKVSQLQFGAFSVGEKSCRVTIRVLSSHVWGSTSQTLSFCPLEESKVCYSKRL